MGTRTKSQMVAFNAALFRESCIEPSFANLLTDGASKQMKGKSSNQTSKDAPIIRVTDMEKGGGDEVEVDIFHRLTGRPTMGSKKLEGRGESMTQAHMKLKIAKGRHMVDVGDTFAQFKTAHDLAANARTLLAGTDGYYGRLRDQRILTHLAGARGHSFSEDDDLIPLADDPEFAEIMVNEVLPPTYDRYMGGSMGDALEDLDQSDLFSMDVLENLRLRLDEMKTMKIPQIRFQDDKQAVHDPLNLLCVSPRQFYDLVNSATGKDYQKMQVDAQKRASGWNHPIFLGDTIYWRGILVRKMNRYVEFHAGKAVDVSNNDNAATVTQQTPATKLHRALLIGGQALASAFGNVGKKEGGTSGYMTMHEEKVDHEDSKEISIKWMTGEKKVRFANKQGRVNDFGVMAVDTAVSE